jgi:hypothetical protein
LAGVCFHVGNCYCVVFLGSCFSIFSDVLNGNHGMARHQIGDGGDVLQIWRVAVDVLNIQKRTTDKGCSVIVCSES